MVAGPEFVDRARRDPADRAGEEARIVVAHVDSVPERDRRHAAGCGPRAHPGVKMLHLPYPVASLSADGTRVAVGPAQHSPQLALKTPPFVLWDPRTGHVDRFSGHGCAEPWGTTLAGRRIA